MSIRKGQKTYQVNEEFPVSESGELLEIDNQLSQRIVLDVGGTISLRGWTTRELVL